MPRLEPAGAQAHRLAAVERDRDNERDRSRCIPPEQALPGARRPDDQEKQGISEGTLNQIAPPAARSDEDFPPGGRRSVCFHARDVKAIRRAYSRITAGSGSCPRVVRVMAAVRISAPPAQA